MQQRCLRLKRLRRNSQLLVQILRPRNCCAGSSRIAKLRCLVYACKEIGFGMEFGLLLMLCTQLLMLILRPLAGVDVWIDVRIVVVLILRPSAAISPCRCLFRSSVFCSVFQFWSSGV